MNKTLVKKAMKEAGFEGRLYFRKSKEFGTPDNYGPAIHRRLIDLNYDLSDVMHSVERDGFETVVFYVEPKSYYFYRHLFSLKKHVWTKSEINGLRKGLGFCSPWSKVAKEEFAQDIMRMDFAYSITKEQTAFGIEWLKNTQFNRHGRLRAAKTTFIGEREAAIIRTFKRFEFTGLRFQDYNQYSQSYQNISPIYRVISKSGESFEYSCTPMGRYGACYEVVS